MPAGRYLLGAGHPVRVPLHQLLERDGLRVRRAGDLQTPGESVRPPHPAFSLLPSLARVLLQGGGPGRWGEPPTPAQEPSPLLQPELQASPRGRTRTRVCAPLQSQIPAGKGHAVQRGLRAHTWAVQMRWVSGSRTDRPPPLQGLLEQFSVSA